MNDALVHRGPDDNGMFVQANVGLAMRRLSIIDLDGGAQPVKSEDGTVQLIFNGEIYNYRALRRDLEARGHRFASHSDTETIVHQYEDRGERAVESLRGMFAFALWDASTQQLLLATDRFGIKPLYYAAGSWGITFASELASLRSGGLVDGDLDLAALTKYFTFGYVPHPDTIFSGVKKLPPASLLTWTPGKPPSITCYWTPPLAGRDTAKADMRPELRERLRDAVRSHLESDVPIGVFLSGGMDSASIVALMSEVSTDPIRTFSIGFEDQGHDELDLARLVATRFQTEHEEIVVTPDAASVLPRLARHFGEPFADASALPTYFVARAAGERVKVALSGDGGDELFLGYTMFRGLELARRLESLPYGVRVRLRQLVDRGRSRRSIGDRWLKRASDSLAGTRSAYYGKLAMPGLPAIAPCLRGDLAAELARQEPYDSLERIFAEELAASGEQPLEPFVRSALRFSLPGDMLVKVDRTSMANSLEVRVPFLDHELAEFVSSLPISERLPGGQLKGLLRKTMADVLPAETVAARKRGFTVPLTAWFSNGLRDFVSDVLLDGDSRSSDFLDRRAVERLIRGSIESLERATVLWSLMMFELWWTQSGIASPKAAGTPAATG